MTLDENVRQFDHRILAVPFQFAERMRRQAATMRMERAKMRRRNSRRDACFPGAYEGPR